MSCLGSLSSKPIAASERNHGLNFGVPVCSYFQHVRYKDFAKEVKFVGPGTAHVIMHEDGELRSIWIVQHVVLITSDAAALADTVEGCEITPERKLIFFPGSISGTIQFRWSLISCCSVNDKADVRSVGGSHW